MDQYSVKKLSEMAGVTVRTLHLYDQLDLLKPSARSESGYRLYGSKELYRLQQILFYRELDFSLEEIRAILDQPDFNLVRALEEHKVALIARRTRLTSLLETVDKTIYNLKHGTKMKPEELYHGLAREQAESMRAEAVNKYGSSAVEQSEAGLVKLGKEGFAELKEESRRIAEDLYKLKGEEPESDTVQKKIATHYNIIRKFWGTSGSADNQAEAYSGLGQLYATDERYSLTGGKADLEFGRFMSRAMKFFAETTLKKK